MARIEDLRIDQAVPKPRRKRPSPWPWLLGVAAVLLWLGLRGGLKLPAASDIQRLAGGTSEVELYIIPDSSGGPAGSISAGGYLEVIPPGPSVVSSIVPGKVNAILATPGEPVTAGAVLARLDSSLLEREAAVLASDVELAQSRLLSVRAGFRSQEIEQAEARLRSAEASRAKAAADAARMEDLYAKGVISLSELESFRTALALAESDVSSAGSELTMLRSGSRSEDIAVAQAQVDAARARLSEVQWKIRECEIKCPRSGVVYEQLAQEGDWLSPLDGGADAAAVASIIDPRQIQAYVDVNQRDSESISIGQLVSLSTDSQPGREIQGTVSRIMPQANLQKNTVRVKIAIADPPADLRPELSVKVTFLPPDMPEDEQPLPGVLVPQTAVVEREGQRGVFINAAGAAAWRPLELGAAEGSDIRALSGISAGEQVVLNPGALKDGDKIKASAAPAAAADDAAAGAVGGTDG